MKRTLKRTFSFRLMRLFDAAVQLFDNEPENLTGQYGSVGAHFSTKSQLFWLVPLRLYLGFMWLTEGIKKLNEGWLTKVILGPGTDAATSASVVDATTSASVMSLVGPHTPGWYSWIVENLIYPNALLFQRLIVCTEIALGIAFLLGLFTVLAALVSIVMNINFILSTGVEHYWYLAASIAMIAGAGRAFGLDHYLVPFLIGRWSERRRLGSKGKVGAGA